LALNFAKIAPKSPHLPDGTDIDYEGMSANETKNSFTADHCFNLHYQNFVKKWQTC